MLKTNSKKAIENIRKYIMDNYNDEYESSACGVAPTNGKFSEIAVWLLTTFRYEKFDDSNLKRYYGYCESRAFEDWCAGLTSALDTCYYYNRPAVEDLGSILEETEAEKSKYKEEDAEKLLTKLIYRELLKGEAEYAKENHSPHQS